MSKRVIRGPALRAKLNVSRSTLHRWENDPSSGFPKRVQLGVNSVGYFENEIDEWLANRPRVSDIPSNSLITKSHASSAAGR